jgi:hypothetical protein
MTRGKLINSITDSISFLKTFSLFKSRGVKGNGSYSNEFLEVSKGDDIFITYNCALRNFDYDILLSDDSIFQFQLHNDELRYAFIQNPKQLPTREEFLALILEIDPTELHSLDDLESLASDEEYEQFLLEQKRNSSSNYFRYDYSSVGYIPLIHSYSHIHIGLNENVRIPISKILTPLNFTKFCVKNTYYEIWKSNFNKIENFDREIARIKSECRDLSPVIWQEIERGELFLN